MNLFRKSIAALLVLTTMAQTAIPAFSAAAYSKDAGTFVLTDADGNQTIVDESWDTGMDCPKRKPQMLCR